jgi:RNA polymerase sigma-70 factor (family 1)
MNSFDTDQLTNRRIFFDHVYTTFWDKVINDAYKRLGDPNQAQDIAQEVFTRFWKRSGQPDPIDDVAAYLFISTRNAVFRHFELQKRRASIPAFETSDAVSQEGADANLALKELTQAFQAMVDVLPPQQRIIFKMKYEQELNSQEIAHLLNVSPKTVRNQIGRALSSLKKSLSYMPFFLLLSAL